MQTKDVGTLSLVGLRIAPLVLVAALLVASPARADAPTPTSDGSIDGPTYAVRLADLEKRIEELKARTFRPDPHALRPAASADQVGAFVDGLIAEVHAKSARLHAVGLAGRLDAAFATVELRNELGSGFRPVAVRVLVDGALVRETDVSAPGTAERPVFEGAIAVGAHAIRVEVDLRGQGWGVFAYLSGYRFTVRAQRALVLTTPAVVHVRAIAFRRGDATTAMTDAEALRIETDVELRGVARRTNT